MLLRHTLIYGLAKGVPGIITFCSLMVFSRMMSPEEYGKYSIIIVIVNVANAILFQWLRLSLIRFIPANTGKSLYQLKGTIIAGFLIIVGITFLTACILIIIYPDQIVYVSLGLTYLWFLAWFELNQTLYRTNLHPVKFGIITLVKSVVSLSISIILLYLSFGEIGPIIGLLIGSIFSVWKVSFKEWHIAYLRNISKLLLKSLIMYGLPLTITFAMATIIRSSDRLIIDLLVGTDEAGLYALASDFAQQSLLLLMMIVNLGAVPIVIKKMEVEGVEAASRQLRLNFILLAALSIPSTVGIIMLTPNIASVFLGKEYVESSIQLIPLIMLGAFLAGVKSSYFDIVFQLKKKTSYQLFPVLFAAAISISCNFLMIPLLGSVGAAISSLIAYTVAVTLSWVFSKRLFPISVPWRELFQIGLSSLVMACVLIPLMKYEGLFALAIQTSIGFIIYMFVLWIVNFHNMRTIVPDILKALIWGHQIKLKEATTNKEGTVKDEA